MAVKSIVQEYQDAFALQSREIDGLQLLLAFRERDSRIVVAQKLGQGLGRGGRRGARPSHVHHELAVFISISKNLSQLVGQCGLAQASDAPQGDYVASLLEVLKNLIDQLLMPGKALGRSVDLMRHRESFGLLDVFIINIVSVSKLLLHIPLRLYIRSSGIPQIHSHENLPEDLPCDIGRSQS